MGRASNEKHRRRQQREQRREQKRARATDQREQRAHPASVVAVPRPETCLPPVHVDEQGGRVPDPRALLGLPAGPLTEDQVRAAWRRALIERPPERDPELARQAREARDRLLEPGKVVERMLGVLHAPDPDRWGLGGGGDGERMAPLTRLAAEAVLYAMVEDALAQRPSGG